MDYKTYNDGWQMGRAELARDKEEETQKAIALAGKIQSDIEKWYIEQDQNIRELKSTLEQIKKDWEKFNSLNQTI
jgi:hypothetical protein